MVGCFGAAGESCVDSGRRSLEVDGWMAWFVRTNRESKRARDMVVARRFIVVVVHAGSVEVGRVFGCKVNSFITNFHHHESHPAPSNKDESLFRSMESDKDSSATLPSKDPNYYFSDGNIIILVEDTLFRVFTYMSY